MTALRDAAEDYLAIRRAVGFKLRQAGRLLFRFVEFLEAEQATRVTTQLALRWATLPAGATPGWWNSRLCVARGFARYLSAIDPATEVPPAGLLPRLGPGSCRAEPYLYSPAEVTALMAAARSIGSRFVAATCETLIGLLAVSGMRIGEALRLDAGDLDWARGVLVIRDSKFNRSREVPLHQSALDALRAYARLRDQRYPQPRSASFFVTRSGRRPSYGTVREHFEHLVHRAGLRPRSARCRPRLHDFRHSFACATQIGGVASDASFGSLREHALPAAQRAVLWCPRPTRPPRGCGDLGLHGPPGSDATTMQLIPLRGPHHHCACWHHDASGSSRLHRVHHRRTQRAAPGRHRSYEGRAGPPHHWSRHAPDLATSRSRCT